MKKLSLFIGTKPLLDYITKSNQILEEEINNNIKLKLKLLFSCFLEENLSSL